MRFLLFLGMFFVVLIMEADILDQYRVEEGFQDLIDSVSGGAKVSARALVGHVSGLRRWSVSSHTGGAAACCCGPPPTLPHE